MSDILTAGIRRDLTTCVLCWLATVSADGRPNVSPKEVFTVGPDGRLLVANIASPVSARNLRARPMACVAAVDVFTQKGWKLEGPAELVEPPDARFEPLAAPLRAIAGPAFPVLGVVCVTVERATPIVAPSYRMVPGTTEASQVESAMQRYGVRPRA
jgi:predicted pyridoxine 5'-phosphate oxidase superfamily flavin-nucleotide-binding protein